MTDLGESVMGAAAILAAAYLFNEWRSRVHKDERDRRNNPKEFMDRIEEFGERMGAVKPRVKLDEDREGTNPFGGK